HAAQRNHGHHTHLVGLADIVELDDLRGHPGAFTIYDLRALAGSCWRRRDVWRRGLLIRFGLFLVEARCFLLRLRFRHAAFRGVQQHLFAFLQSTFDLDELVIKLTDFDLAPVGLEAGDNVADLFAFARRHRLDGHIDDVVEVVHEDFHFGAHARFNPVKGAVDGDGGEIDFEVWVHPAVLGIGQNADFGDFAIKDLVREGIDGNAHLLAFPDFFDVALVDLDLDGHLGHVRDGNDGLALAHRGAFANGLLIAVVIHLVAAAA